MFFTLFLEMAIARSCTFKLYANFPVLLFLRHMFRHNRVNSIATSFIESFSKYHVVVKGRCFAKRRPFGTVLLILLTITASLSNNT